MVNVPDDQKVIIEIRLSSVPLEIAKVKKILPIGTATMKEDSLDGRDDRSWAEKGHPSPVVNDEGFMDLMANNNRMKTNVQECLPPAMKSPGRSKSGFLILGPRPEGRKAGGVFGRHSRILPFAGSGESGRNLFY